MSGSEGSENKLQTSWSFWEHRKSEIPNDYDKNLIKLGTFNTVEGFWRYMNAIPTPSDFFYTEQGGRTFEDREVEGFSLFREGITPGWEDPANSNGGMLFCRQRLSPKQLDETWETLLVAAIGEEVDPGDEICGIRCVDKSKNGRATYRLELWCRNYEKDIVEKLKENLDKYFHPKTQYLTVTKQHSL